MCLHQIWANNNDNKKKSRMRWPNAANIIVLALRKCIHTTWIQAIFAIRKINRTKPTSYDSAIMEFKRSDVVNPAVHLRLHADYAHSVMMNLKPIIIVTAAVLQQLTHLDWWNSSLTDLLSMVHFPAATAPVVWTFANMIVPDILLSFRDRVCSVGIINPFFELLPSLFYCRYYLFADVCY